jgi:nitrite reductase/ring-hydroxylating ferredoxin subunit
MDANLMWVPLALGRDVPPMFTRAVHFEGRELVLWRSADGALQLWEDRCPHRGMRLSLGFVRGNSLNCLYHGWEYRADSVCVRIPAHPGLQVPSTIKTRAFPVIEAAGMVWTTDNVASTALPQLPPSTPLASLAVDAPPDLILAICAAPPQAGAQLFAFQRDDVVFHTGWHEPAPGRTMLHAATRTAADPARAIRLLRDLRDEAETRRAA